MNSFIYSKCNCVLKLKSHSARTRKMLASIGKIMEIGQLGHFVALSLWCREAHLSELICKQCAYTQCWLLAEQMLRTASKTADL